MQGPTHQPRDGIESGIAFFCFLVSLREEIRTRAPTPLKMLPRYVTRTTGGYLFQAYRGGPITRLRGEPGTREFRRAYNAAIVGAIVAERDGDD